MMRRRFPIFGLLLGGLLLFTGFLFPCSSAERPNIVLIMSDDMGFSDIGCYGSEIHTPNLDALAAGGVRFTQFYNTSRCCPTRASLLTGLYPHQAGIGHMMEDKGFEGYRGDLNRHCLTIAEVLRGSGYRTYMTGKWHVTKIVKPGGEADKFNWPLQRGFDRFYGTIHGAGSFFDPNTLTRDNTYISPFEDAAYRPEEPYYYTHALTDHAVRFIRDHQKDHAEAPFFLYLPYTAAHWPLHALPADIAKYKGSYDAGYDAIRAARYEKMKALGLIDASAELSPAAGNWSDVGDKTWESANMEVYAAMIDSMDQGIGKIMTCLRETQYWENTLVLFLQDNGGCAEGMGRGNKNPAPPVRADQPSLKPVAADFLQPDMIPRQTRDGFPMRQGLGVVPGAADTYQGYGQAWANVSNTPFREYKHWVHEGGISTPLIAHWPKGIGRHGELERTPGHLIDIMATCVDVAGAAYPATAHAGQAIHPMEGRSLVPAFAGKPVEREALYWEHEGNRAVRVGDWKLVAKGAKNPWELYDIAHDRSEMHNLAEAEPERAREMGALWQAWAERSDVLPLNPPLSRKNTGKKKTPQ